MRLAIVIPLRPGSRADPTLRTLGRQTWRDFTLVMAQDEWSNANSARNAGWEIAMRMGPELVLFSDDDIEWEADALEVLVASLDRHPQASYAYGAYEIGGRIQCNRGFDALRLRQGNYISTMSMIRAKHFPGFDPAIRRLQDYDLWLTMLAAGHAGVYCGRLIFRTAVRRDGITWGSGISYQDALAVVHRKHGLIK